MLTVPKVAWGTCGFVRAPPAPSVPSATHTIYVCPVIDYEFRHNIVKVAVDAEWIRKESSTRVSNTSQAPHTVRAVTGLLRATQNQSKLLFSILKAEPIH